mgnify:CR=1 FL=1
MTTTIVTQEDQRVELELAVMEKYFAELQGKVARLGDLFTEGRNLITDIVTLEKKLCNHGSP